MKLLVLCLTALLTGQSSAAIDVSLEITRQPRPWHGYPESVNKPGAEWQGNTLHVHVVENEVGLAKEDDPRATINGNQLQLCYQEAPLEPTPGDYQFGGAVMPVLLNFSVTGLPRRDYKISVSHNCARAG